MPAHQGVCREVELRGTLAYLAYAATGGGDGGVEIVDLSDPSSPTLLGWLSTTTASTNWGGSVFYRTGIGINSPKIGMWTNDT